MLSKACRSALVSLSIAAALVALSPVSVFANSEGLASDFGDITSAANGLSATLAEEMSAEDDAISADNLPIAEAEKMAADIENALANDDSITDDEALPEDDSIKGEEIVPQADGDVIYLRKGVSDYRRVSSGDSLVYEFTLSRGGYITLSLQVEALVTLKTSGGDVISLAPGNTSDGQFGPWAMAAGTYRIEVLVTRACYSRVSYNDIFSDYKEYASADPVFEKQFQLSDKLGAYSTNPLKPYATPISVGRPLTGTVYATPYFVDLDYYSFTVPIDAEYEVMVRCADPIWYFLVDNDVNTLQRDGMIASKRYNASGPIVSTLDLGRLVPGRTYVLCFTNYDTFTTDSGKTGGIPTGPYFAKLSEKGVSMYRLYNPNSGEHFYTGDTTERDALTRRGWIYEGVGWVAPVDSNTPVYRLYNKYAGDHHYTMSLDERRALVRYGWTYEGIGWYSDDNERVPLYRQYNPNAKAGSHNYTTSLKENNALIKRGWIEEGIGWYGIAEGSTF